jgi:hypothetical protein
MIQTRYNSNSILMNSLSSRILRTVTPVWNHLWDSIIQIDSNVTRHRSMVNKILIKVLILSKVLNTVNSLVIKVTIVSTEICLTSSKYR